MCLGTKGNEFILNGKLSDVNAEEIYHPLTTPVFGRGVVYDCPNAKLMEQKKVGHRSDLSCAISRTNPFAHQFVKFGLTQQAFDSYVPLIVTETVNFVTDQKRFPGFRGIIDVPPAFAELTIYTASRSLQGKEVRDKFDSTFAELYHDLDMGFAPINFMIPWAPLPHNRRRDTANRIMAQTYMDIVQARKSGGAKKDSEDMIWNLMGSVYKNGRPVPDQEIAHIMIALLMAGQHSSSSTSSWIILRLAQHPYITEELFEEQRRILGIGEDGRLPALTYENLQKLELNAQVVKETLRIHAPIHSIMRKVKSPMIVEGTPYTIPTSHVLLSAPGVTSKVAEHFPNPDVWDPHRWDAVNATQISQTAQALRSHLKPEEAEEKVDYGYGLVTKGANSPYLPFGAGRHRCIGEQFAYLQLGTIIATMVRHLRFINPESRRGIVKTDYSSLFSRPLGPAVVEWERRDAPHLDLADRKKAE